MSKFLAVKDATWGDANHNFVQVTVQFEGFVGWYPFAAAPYDTEAYGRELFQELVDGKYGPISEYVPPAPVPQE